LMGEESYRSFADRVWAEIPMPLDLLLRIRIDRGQVRSKQGNREERRWR
jgi:hypothetical protein